MSTHMYICMYILLSLEGFLSHLIFSGRINMKVGVFLALTLAFHGSSSLSGLDLFR